jgi:ATP-dependent DNA helicase RecQ
MPKKIGRATAGRQLRLEAMYLRVLKDVFGFDRFRDGQRDVVDAILAGRNVLAVMPTGSGKSLCFQVPAVILGGLTIVVSPLVALMHDQVAALGLTGVAADTINSSRPRSENVAAWRRVTAGTTRLLYLSPERLMTERMLAALRQLPVRLIAIDEAHCISQWGPAFRPEYEDLRRLKPLFAEVPIAAFTATADEVTRHDIVGKLFAGDAATFVTGFDRPNIHLAVAMKRDWKQQLLDFVGAHQGDSGIVYCLSRRKTEEAAALLTRHGVRALPYHAGMDGADRLHNQNAFVTERGIVIVATIAFGMGIDKPDVRFVFHTDIAGSLEAYYQEIGRAGRDGLAADACLLYGLDDIRLRRRFIEAEDSDADRKRREHQRLDTLIGYCESPTCRRRTLLAHFGEDREACGNCDVCRSPVELADGSDEGRRVLSAVIATGQRYGAVHIIDVLRGSRTEKVERAGHHLLPSFGSGTGHKKVAWRSIIRQLVAASFLDLDIQGLGGLSVTAKGRALLAGETSFRYRPEPQRGSARKPRAGQMPDAGLAGADLELFDALKRLRLQLAEARNVPAYLIFADRTLAEMARRRPATAADFATLYGVGETKLRDLAPAFLQAIAAMGARPAERAAGTVSGTAAAADTPNE